MVLDLIMFGMRGVFVESIEGLGFLDELIWGFIEIIFILWVRGYGGVEGILGEYWFL